MVIVRDEFFYPILTQIIDTFSCSTLNTAFIYLKKKLPEVPEYAKMLHNMMKSL